MSLKKAFLKLGLLIALISFISFLIYSFSFLNNKIEFASFNNMTYSSKDKKTQIFFYKDSFTFFMDNQNDNIKKFKVEKNNLIFDFKDNKGVTLTLKNNDFIYIYNFNTYLMKI